MSAISLSVSQSALPWTHNTKELNKRSGERFANDTSMPVENKINTHKTHSHTLTHVRWNFCQSSAVSRTHTLLQTVCVCGGDHSTRLVYCNAFSLQCVRPELLQWCLLSVELGPIRWPASECCVWDETQTEWKLFKKARHSHWDPRPQTQWKPPNRTYAK